jgi:hypothetical protein
LSGALFLCLPFLGISQSNVPRGTTKIGSSSLTGDTGIH